MRKLVILLFVVTTLTNNVLGQITDTLKMSYVEYSKYYLKPDFIILTDIFNNPFELITHSMKSQKTTNQLFIDSAIIKVDTTIMVGFDTMYKNKNEDVLINLFNSNFRTPKFESKDAVSVIFSVFANENGKIKSINILKDIPRKCSDDSVFTFHYHNLPTLIPTSANGKFYNVSYIIQVFTTCYCSCNIINKE